MLKLEQKQKVPIRTASAFVKTPPVKTLSQVKTCESF